MPIINQIETLRLTRRLNGTCPGYLSHHGALTFTRSRKNQFGGEVESAHTYIHLTIPGAGTILRFIKTGQFWQQENLSL